MAGHAAYGDGCLVRRLASSQATPGRLLLFHQQQCVVGYLGMAYPGLGAGGAAILPVHPEPAGVAKEHAVSGLIARCAEVARRRCRAGRVHG